MERSGDWGGMSRDKRQRSGDKADRDGDRKGGRWRREGYAARKVARERGRDVEKVK